jgi:hypothetical protein
MIRAATWWREKEGKGIPPFSLEGAWEVWWTIQSFLYNTSVIWMSAYVYIWCISILQRNRFRPHYLLIISFTVLTASIITKYYGAGWNIYSACKPLCSISMLIFNSTCIYCSLNNILSCSGYTVELWDDHWIINQGRRWLWPNLG